MITIRTLESVGSAELTRNLPRRELGFRYLFRDAEIPVPSVIIDESYIPDMHAGEALCKYLSLGIKT